MAEEKLFQRSKQNSSWVHGLILSTQITLLPKTNQPYYLFIPKQPRHKILEQLHEISRKWLMFCSTCKVDEPVVKIKTSTWNVLGSSFFPKKVKSQK